MRTLILFLFIFSFRQSVFSQTDKSGLDTVFCDIQNTSCINLSEEVTLVDVGNPQQFVAQIKGNLVFVKPVKENILPTTILIKSGKNIYHGTLVYNKTGKTKPYYYEIKSAGGETNTAKKETIKSEIKTLGFISENVDAAVTVIRNDENNTYLKLIVKNKSSLPFKLDFISFQYYQDMKKGAFRKSKKAPIDVFPVGEPAIKEIAPSRSEALPYVIPAYALSNNGYLMVLIRESTGDRVLKIKIDGSVIQGSEQLIIEKKNK